MGRYILPIVVLVVGGGAAFIGYRLASEAAKPEEKAVKGGGRSRRVGQVTMPAAQPMSQWEKDLIAEGIVLSL